MFSPMEQYLLFPVFQLPALVVSNLVWGLLIASTIMVTLMAPTSKILSNNWGILSESLFRTILGMLETFVNRNAAIYLPLFFSVFHLILFSNLLGLVPYSSTPTVEIALTMLIAITLLGGILLIGFLTHGTRLLAIFLPGGTPLALIPLMVALEVIAYFSRTLSLGLRLAINLITGHILAKVCAGFLWLGYISGTSIFILAIGFILFTLFLTLEVLVAYLQAYIFIFIAILTLKDVSMT
jgi:F-type H+-transporting ATPase subunit a